MSSGDRTSQGMAWDHEDCPEDGCDGELQQQDRYNVMCLFCEGVWTHVKTEMKHMLQTQDFETVATKPIVMADGGSSAGDLARTSEPATVEWVGGLGDTQTVHVDPYAGKITVNGREFEINALCSRDVPDWMYREVDTGPDQEAGSR